MPSFKEIVNSKNEAFGIKIAGANRKLQMKSLQEKIMRTKDDAKEMMFDKYYLVPKDYTKVQWKAFASGVSGRFFPGFFGSPLWFTLLAASNYVQGISNALAGKYRLSPWLVGNIDLIAGAAFLAVASYARVKKMRREEWEKLRNSP